ncbi:MAG TPA: hypothetical protein VF069_26235 [Streptosporangiaceae bacterium]
MPPVIRREHLERLLQSPDRDAVLVISEGRAAVVPEAATRGGEHEGALLITSRDALIAEFDAGANMEQLDQLAQRLDVAYRDMGG